MKQAVVWMLLGVPLAGCAGAVPVPAARFSASLVAIRDAEQLGAARDPRAELYLRLAQREARRAEQLASRGELERARWLAIRAQSDAELAQALARAEQARAQAQEAARQAAALQQGVR